MRWSDIVNEVSWGQYLANQIVLWLNVVTGKTVDCGDESHCDALLTLGLTSTFKINDPELEDYIDGQLDKDIKHFDGDENIIAMMARNNWVRVRITTKEVLLQAPAEYVDRAKVALKRAKLLDDQTSLIVDTDF